MRAWPFSIARAAVRVVILNHKPYPAPFTCTRAFAVPSWCSRWPAALTNIAAEIRADVEEKLWDGTLVSWERQGVLLLTVQGNEALCREVLVSLPNVVVIACGNATHKLAKHYAAYGSTILYIPAPAHASFTGCKVFSRCNRFVKGPPIRWGVR